MDAVQQTDLVGFSDLFPVLPLFSLASLVCCMLILPAFIKTRVFTLVTLTLWLALGNLLICINLCIWRNNTRNIPIYSDFVAHIWAMYPIIVYLNHLCFLKFVWNITRPGSSLNICDKRQEYNRLDVFLTVVLPILWTPLSILTRQGRYTIVEDIGPLNGSALSLGVILFYSVPMLLVTVASVWFAVLALINVWRAQRTSAVKKVMGLGHSSFYRDLTITKAVKYLVMSTTALFGLMFGCIWATRPIFLYIKNEGPWYRTDIRDNIRQLPLIYITYRYELEDPIDLIQIKLFLFSIPVTGILFFFFFGLGPEALARYHAWIQFLSSFLKLPSLCNFLWAHALRLGWLNNRIRPVDPEYFGPLESNDITLDPHPFVLPQTLGRSHLPMFPTQPTIGLPYYPTPFRATQPSAPLSVPSLGEWRTYHKGPLITAFHLPTRYSPASSQFRTGQHEVSTEPGRWRAHREESIPPQFPSSALISSSPDRPWSNVDSPSTGTPSDFWSTSYMKTGYPWLSSIRGSARYDESPPPYRPPVNRGDTSKDPLSALF
ncbi:hypothetical protein FRC18_002175 [Serendipita sp. 400]|nr:hypothetical protein FRC18_002175 [Serendipita sp. 400]